MTGWYQIPTSSTSSYCGALCNLPSNFTLHIANWRHLTVDIVKTKFSADIGCFEIEDVADHEDRDEIEADFPIITKQRNHQHGLSAAHMRTSVMPTLATRGMISSAEICVLQPCGRTSEGLTRCRAPGGR